MSNVSFRHHLHRTDHDFEWQKKLVHYESSQSLALPPGFDAKILSSLPLAPGRWSGRVDNGYRTVESSLGLSGDDKKDAKDIKDVKDDEFVSTVELKQAPSYNEISVSGVIPSRSGEVPKVAIQRGLRGNWTKFVPHIIAILVTVGVCQLSFRSVYWMDLQQPNQQIALGLTQGGVLNLLQLAAKLHELLILASISSILLHIVQVHLIGHSGVPLGMISNAFELGSARFLLRRFFWTMLWSGNQLHLLPLWIFSIFSTILVVLSGPSSAIVVIPTLNYFDLPRPFNQSVLPYYVFNHSTELWPTHLTVASLTAPNTGVFCNDSQSLSEQNECPVGGFRDTYNWAGNLLFANSDHGTNISFPDTTGDTRRTLTATSCNRDGFDGRASAVTVNAFLSNALTTYQNFHGTALESVQPHINIDSNTKIFSPRVETICHSYANYDFNPKIPNDQPDMFFPVYGDSNSTSYPVPNWTYKYTRAVNASNFTFVEMSNIDPLSPSLGAVLTLPLIESTNGSNWFQTTENLACSIYSQWIPVDVWYEPTMNDQVSYTITSSLSDTCLTLPIDEKSERHPINTTIGAEYANAINQPIAFVDSDIPALLATFQRFIFNDSTYIPNGVIFKAPIPGVAGVAVTDDDARKQRAKLVSTVLAGVVADGLARNAGAGTFPYSSPAFILPNRTAEGSLLGRFPVTSATGGEDDALNTTHSADELGWLRLDPTIQRFGYGYRWQGSRTAQFGITVLLIHALVAIIHIIFLLTKVLSRGEGIQRAWESIPELLALAVNSRPSEQLRNTCAGIGEEKTYTEPVAVRETTDGHLEAILGKDEIGRFDLPKADVRYGTFLAMDARSRN